MRVPLEALDANAKGKGEGEQARDCLKTHPVCRGATEGPGQRPVGSSEERPCQD